MSFKQLFLAGWLIIGVVTCACAATIETPDGAFIYYETKGEGSPILFVHGWTMSEKFWQKQVQELAKDHQVVVMDLRAHGNSSKTLYGHTIPQYARDVRSVIDALKLKNVTLIGWSLAGPVVLDYWKQFGADKVKALGLVDMTPFPFSPAQWNAHGLKNFNYDRMNAFFIALNQKRGDVATAFINNMFKSGKAPEKDLEWMLTEHLKTPVSVAQDIYSDYLMRDYSDVLKTITVPTIVFAADSNIFKNGIAMGKHTASQIPNATFAPSANGGHLLFYEDPKWFNNELTTFFKKCGFSN
jgi:pimeloyl-ACP methyl ester carboxylesterase